MPRSPRNAPTSALDWPRPCTSATRALHHASPRRRCVGKLWSAVLRSDETTAKKTPRAVGVARWRRGRSASWSARRARPRRPRSRCRRRRDAEREMLFASATNVSQTRSGTIWQRGQMPVPPAPSFVCCPGLLGAARCRGWRRSSSSRRRRGRCRRRRSPSRRCRPRSRCRRCRRAVGEDGDQVARRRATPSASALPAVTATRGSFAKSSTSNAPSPLQSSWRSGPAVVCGIGSSPSLSATFLRRLRRCSSGCRCRHRPPIRPRPKLPRLDRGSCTTAYRGVNSLHLVRNGRSTASLPSRS